LTTVTNGRNAWADVVDRLAELLCARDVRARDDVDLDGVVLPQTLLVLRHLRAALALADAETAPICARLDAMRSRLYWRQNETYTGATFLDGYAYCELLGPNGMQRETDFALGLLLLAPRTTYPDHAHPAAEVYAVVAGRAEWRQGDAVWRERVPGERIRHASLESHAMRTRYEPLLAAYLWEDHLDEGARLLVERDHPEA
jgi:hypothetical protein